MFKEHCQGRSSLVNFFGWVTCCAWQTQSVIKCLIIRSSSGVKQATCRSTEGVAVWNEKMYSEIIYTECFISSWLGSKRPFSYEHCLEGEATCGCQSARPLLRRDESQNRRAIMLRRIGLTSVEQLGVEIGLTASLKTCTEPARYRGPWTE